MLKHIQVRVSDVAVLRVRRGRLDDGSGNSGIAKDRQQRVTVHHLVLVVGLPKVDVLVHDSRQDLVDVHLEDVFQKTFDNPLLLFGAHTVGH